jgi:hypothetical protein
MEKTREFAAAINQRGGGDNICRWIDGTVLRISWAWYLEAFRFFNLGFLGKSPYTPPHRTRFSQAPRHPQSAVHLLLEHTVALDLFSTRIIFYSSVHSSYSFDCCPQVLIRLMTLAFNLGLTLPLVPRLFVCAHFIQSPLASLRSRVITSYLPFSPSSIHLTRRHASHDDHFVRAQPRADWAKHAGPTYNPRNPDDAKLEYEKVASVDRSKRPEHSQRR